MIDKEEVNLPSGKVIKVRGGLVAISINGKDDESNRFSISFGGNDEISVFDSKADYKRFYDFDYIDDHQGDLALTAEDRKFLAELMIARWQEFGGIKKT